ncbi:MAG: O-antigen ligase family protein [Acidobacteria bacterium]|nr:O-antigen ligase family protein [Acidobacteriota bacterium]
MTADTAVASGRFRWGLFVISCAALFPIGVDELSVNYLFVLVPVAWVVSRGRVEHLPPLLQMAAVVFGLVFVLSIVIAPDQVDLLARRVASFLVFVTFLAFSFVRLRAEDVDAFKLAVVTMSVAFSLYAIFAFLEASAAGPVHFEAKNLVGSQRYGFVYVAGLWILLLGQRRGGRAQIVRLAGLIVVTAGLGLTFSRSAFIATVGSIALFAAARVVQRVVKLEIKIPGPKVIVGLVFAVVALAVTLRSFPLTIEFYQETLLAPIADRSLFESMGQSGTSEGIRVVRVQETLSHLASYPLTGTGYLGIWTISPSGGGSAHNQLLDVLLRVGIAGFLMYLVILASLMRFLARADTSLFWGLVAILIYGFFHETFKESQGAFVLAFLVGMMAQDWRDRRSSRARQNGVLPGHGRGAHVQQRLRPTLAGTGTDH